MKRIYVVLGLGLWGLAGTASLATAQALRVPAPTEAQLAAVPQSVREALDAARNQLQQATAKAAVAADEAAAWAHLGDVFFVHEFNNEARVAYQHAVALDPRRFEWHYLLGMLELSVENVAEAITSLDIAIGLDPDNYPARIRRGRAHLDSADLDRAKTDFEHAQAVSPEAAAALGGLGRVALERGKYREAVELLSSALALDPAASSLHHTLGMAYRGLGELDLARRHLALRGDREETVDDPLLARVQSKSRSPQFLLELGLGLADRGDLQGSLAMMARVLRLEPNNPQALLNAGEILARLDRIDDAHAVFLRLAEADPQSGVALFYLGQIEEVRGKPAAAIESYRKALELDAAYADARAALSRVLLQSGEPEASARGFRELLAAASMPTEQAEYSYWLGLAEIAQNDCVRAREAVARAHELSPQPLAEYLDALVRIDSTCAAPGGERLKEIVAIGEQLYDFNTGLDSAETLAMAYAANGRFEDAVDLQRYAIFEAVKAGVLSQRPALQENLARYESGERSIRPYGQGHPLFSPHAGP